MAFIGNNDIDVEYGSLVIIMNEGWLSLVIFLNPKVPFTVEIIWARFSSLLKC